jgi:hypothetical protein
MGLFGLWSVDVAVQKDGVPYQIDVCWAEMLAAVAYVSLGVLGLVGDCLEGWCGPRLLAVSSLG